MFRREEAQKQRCRVAARAALLASLPDDLRRVIGRKYMHSLKEKVNLENRRCYKIRNMNIITIETIQFGSSSVCSQFDVDPDPRIRIMND